MFGMDNYYGAPYLVVNNGDPKWLPFQKLKVLPALQTDLLSQQWFCLAYEFAFKELDEYRDLIFQNTRKALSNLPLELQNRNASLRVNTIDADVDPCFIDIKVQGLFHKLRSIFIIAELARHYLSHNIPITPRASIGFHQANVNLITIHESNEASSIRITLGTNHEEVSVIKEFIENLRDYL